MATSMRIGKVRWTCSIVIVAACGVGIAFLLLAPIWPSEGDFHCLLPNGYSLNRTDAETCSIEGPLGQAGSNPIVSPNILELQVNGNVVYGLAYQSQSLIETTVAGYFVLDTTSGTVETGMKEADWLTVLRNRYGIRRPELLKRRDFFRKTARSYSAQVECNRSRIDGESRQQ